MNTLMFIFLLFLGCILGFFLSEITIIIFNKAMINVNGKFIISSKEFIIFLKIFSTISAGIVTFNIIYRFFQ